MNKHLIVDTGSGDWGRRYCLARPQTLDGTPDGEVYSYRAVAYVEELHLARAIAELLDREDL